MPLTWLRTSAILTSCCKFHLPNANRHQTVFVLILHFTTIDRFATIPVAAKRAPSSSERTIMWLRAYVFLNGERSFCSLPVLKPSLHAHPCTALLLACAARTSGITIPLIVHLSDLHISAFSSDENRSADLMTLSHQLLVWRPHAIIISGLCESCEGGYRTCLRRNCIQCAGDLTDGKTREGQGKQQEAEWRVRDLLG